MRQNRPGPPGGFTAAPIEPAQANTIAHILAVKLEQLTPEAQVAFIQAYFKGGYDV